MSTDIFFFIGYFIIILILYSLKWTKDFANKNSNELIGVTSAYFYLLADIKNDNDNKIFFDYTWKDINTPLVYLGIILALIYLYINYINKDKFINDESLIQENTQLKENFKVSQKEFYKLCSDIIKGCFGEFYESSNGNGRISIYKYDNNSFTLLGRYCSNPLYNSEGRPHYPENEGIIAIGWQNGTASIHNIPKYTNKGREWKKRMKEICNISDNSLDKIKMKSQSFHVQRINNEDSRNPLGIIVAEKLSSEIINEELITLPLKLHNEIIASLIKSMKTITK
ncbi:hypothetical protein [Chryseobacterium sp.]|uniref:hypothetical protein n=1 Tax=Chryseobacterium sp. TaxID=1871047 RepID=UPI0026321240|nr:hypothetical protein [Chryseobacterium sp.]